MPLVRISLREGKSSAYGQAIGEGVHRAMVETINVPALDRFEEPPSKLGGFFDPSGPESPCIRAP